MFLKYFENPKRPLLGPNVYSLQFWGILLPENVHKRIICIFLHFSIMVFTATEYVEIWFVRSDVSQLYGNLKVTLLATVSVFKIATFLLWQKHWKLIIDYVTRADITQRYSKDLIKQEIISKYTKYSRNLTYPYWLLTYSTSAVVAIQPIIKYFSSPVYRDNVNKGTEPYMQVVSSWVPFDKNTMPGYLAASIIQFYAALHGCGWMASYDTNAIVIMVFFRGELEMLKRDCANIYGGEKKLLANEIAMERLKSCRKRHVELVKYAKLFDSCLSPIMFLYTIVCSIMLCLTVYQIKTEASAMQRFLSAEYLVFGISQLLIYCWHSNEVYYMSRQVSRGTFASRWWAHKGVRKHLFILTAQLSRTVVFSAGPLITLNLATFIGILKGAYSYYTLLNNK